MKRIAIMVTAAVVSCLALLLSATPASADTYVRTYETGKQCVAAASVSEAIFPWRDYYCKRGWRIPGEIDYPYELYYK
jgi:hypothetical protein